MPSAGDAPAPAQVRDDAIEDHPLHPERGTIAVGAVIAAREQEEESHGRDDEEEDEDRHEDRHEGLRVGHVT